MSHRSQILFKQDELSVLTYKHWGGFPETVIPLLRDYWQWFPRKDIDYLTATWFYYCKRRMEDRIRNKNHIDTDISPVETTQPREFHGVALNYGICSRGRLNGDSEHFYVVDIEAETIEHYTPADGFLFASESLTETTARTPDYAYPLIVDESNKPCVDPKQGGDDE